MSVTYPTPVAEPNSAGSPRRHGNRRAWLAAIGLSAVVVLGAALEIAPGHQFWSNVASPTVAAAEQAPAQTDPQLAAIQRVIQQGNTEQSQAIASQNASVMSDTSTQPYLQQLTQVNQALLAQGVTDIRLTNLNWGPINVNGDNATATTYETWVTTLSDGTTMQSTDTNNYTLVQQNGNWVISDDQQPTSASASQPRSTIPPTSVNPDGSHNTSRNWSGYAATGKTYTSVSGTWTVPQPLSTSSAGVGATWVGIGGVNSRDLIQAGTQDVASGSGQSQFQAWIETLPQPSQQVRLAVSPGDSVTVSITESSPGSGMWTIAFKNNTTGKSYQTNVRYNSSESSAEWIEEAPASGNGIVPLDNFGSVPFTAATAVADGQTIDLAQAGAQPITMLNANGQALAVPSSIGSDGASFDVSRTSASATPASSGRRGFGATPGLGGGAGFGVPPAFAFGS